MVYMQQQHLQQVPRCDIKVMTCKILLLLFYIWTSYVSRSDYLIPILKLHAIPVRLQDVTTFLFHKTISRKRVDFFYSENMPSYLNYVTGTLRTLFAWRSSYIYAFNYYTSLPIHEKYIPTHTSPISWGGTLLFSSTALNTAANISSVNVSCKMYSTCNTCKANEKNKYNHDNANC